MYGQINGRSLIELHLGDNPVNAKRAIISSVFEDVVVSKGAYTSLLKFKLDNDGLVTESTAELSSDGKTINGVSRQEGFGKGGKVETAHYTWVARRM